MSLWSIKNRLKAIEEQLFHKKGDIFGDAAAEILIQVYLHRTKEMLFDKNNSGLWYEPKELMEVVQKVPLSPNLVRKINLEMNKRDILTPDTVKELSDIIHQEKE